MLTEALAPGAADSPTTNPVSLAGWKSPSSWGFGLFYHDSFGESPETLRACMTGMGGGVLGGSGLLGRFQVTVDPIATVCFCR